jgi:glutathione S-transferase
MASADQKIKVYGLKVSYFTGKLESYLRYKEIPHEFCTATSEYFRKILPEKTGALQVPAVELPDGRWMTDTSPIIDWFETQYREHPILPVDPVQAFLARLIEDYADEWLWRPAMHYRWSYPTSSKLLRRQIVDEMGVDANAPNWVLRLVTERRQYRNFVAMDGVNDATRAHVEQGYLNLLSTFSDILKHRPFVFGQRPSLADIGLMGPLLRHFSMDPVPAVIMRETAPAVMEWVYRMWNAKASQIEGGFVDGVPDDLSPLLKEIGETHLQNLCANAEAWASGKASFGVALQRTQYTDVPTSRYRAWCLEKLQRRFKELDDASRATVTKLLEQQGCLEPLLHVKEPRSNYDPDGQAPFGRSIAVYSVIKG